MKKIIFIPLIYGIFFGSLGCEESSSKQEEMHISSQAMQGEPGSPWFAGEFPFDDGIPVPYIPGPVHICAQSVYVTGGLEGGFVEVYDDGGNVLNAAGPIRLNSRGSARVPLSREVEEGDVFRARQLINTQPSDLSLPREAGYFTGPMPRPVIDSEPFECTNRVRVKGVIPGARLTVTNLTTTQDDVEWPSNPDSIYYANWHQLSPLGSANQPLQAQQVMCPDRDPEDPRQLISPPSTSASILARPNPVPPPESVEHTVGTDFYLANGLIVGAYQDILDNSVSTGWHFHPAWPNIRGRWDIEPATKLGIVQKMCEQSSQPTPATTYPESDLDRLWDPPEILEPICPDARVIEARASMSGGKLGVLDSNSDYLGAQATPDGTNFTRLTLPQGVSLPAGETIIVRHVLRNGQAKEASATVLAQDSRLEIVGAKAIEGVSTITASSNAAGPAFRFSLCCPEAPNTPTMSLRITRDDGADYGTIELQKERSGLYEGRWDWLVPNVSTPDGIWPPRENHVYQATLETNLGSCTPASPVKFDVVKAPPVTSTNESETILTHVVSLGAGQTVELQALRRSGDGDPMLRVFEHNKNADQGVYSNTELASDDNSAGGVNALIPNFTAPQTGKYLLVVHDVSEKGEGGRVDLVMDGTRLLVNKAFGGQVMEIGRPLTGDQVETLFEPNGDRHHQLLVLSGSVQGGATYFGQHEDEPSRRSVRYEYTSSPSSTQFLVFGSINPTGRGMGAVFNRLGYHDTDGDGLADSLERRLGSCTTSSGALANGWDCGTYSSRDTDNDGLSDAEEVLGVQASDDDIPFRFWGASPRHKDVFLEFDWDETIGENTDATSSLVQDDIEQTQAYFAAGTDQELGNPDGRPGIALHFDIDQKPYTTRMGTTGLAFDGGGSNYIAGGEKCLNFHEQRRLTNMTQTRQRYFRHMCGKKNSASRANIPSLGLDVLPSSRFISHESGHMLGLGHGGGDSMSAKPNYFSLMNYTFGEKWNAQFSGLRDARFSKGQYSDITPGALCERDGLQGGPILHLDETKNRDHKFSIDEANGWIDWNLDGIFSPCSTPVRGAPTFVHKPGLPAYPFIQGTQIINNYAFYLPKNDDFALSKAPVDSVENLLVFFAYQNNGTDTIFYRRAPYNGSCTGDAFDLDEGCLDWSALFKGTGIDGTDVSAARFTESNGDVSVYLTVLNAQNEVRIAKGTFGGSNPSFVYESYGTSLVAQGKPDILAHNGKLHAVWKNTSGQLWGTTKTASGTWSTPSILTNSAGVTWTSGIPVSLASSPLGMHMVRTRAGGNIDLLRYNEAQNKWENADTRFDMADGLHVTQSEAKAVWFQGFTNDPSGPGHWQLVYIVPDLGWRIITLGASQDKESWWTSRSDANPLELLYMPEHDNVVGMQVNPATARFLPFADGVIGGAISDHNDFTSMSQGICFGYPETIPGDSRPCGRLGAPNALTLPNYYTGVCDGY